MEDSKYVTWDVHNEFTRRIDAENSRQNARISDIEKEVKQISDLVASVKVLAANMETMAKEQAKMGDRLQAIEEKPAKRWDAIVGAIITGVVGILIGLISAGIIK